MKRKRKERWNDFEFLIQGWVQFNMTMYRCLPDAFKAKRAAEQYCDYMECARGWLHYD